MRKTIVAAAAAVLLALGLVACGTGNDAADTDDVGSDASSSEDAAQIANPWSEVETLDDAANATGFTMAAPDALDGYAGRTIQVMDNAMIEVIYGDADDGAAPLIYVRKSVSEGEDISGDYNEYAESGTLDVDGIRVEVRGEGGLWYVATWSSGGSSFSISSTGGLDEATLAALVRQVG